MYEWSDHDHIHFNPADDKSRKQIVAKKKSLVIENHLTFKRGGVKEGFILLDPQ